MYVRYSELTITFEKPKLETASAASFSLNHQWQGISRRRVPEKYPSGSGQNRDMGPHFLGYLRTSRTRIGRRNIKTFLQTSIHFKISKKFEKIKFKIPKNSEIKNYFF